MGEFMLIVDYLLLNKQKRIDEREFQHLIKYYKMEETEIGPICCDCKRSWIDKWKTILILEK